eukprot:scaffold13281_cov119-Isochrysis_galbana.AAC.2
MLYSCGLETSAGAAIGHREFRNFVRVSVLARRCARAALQVPGSALCGACRRVANGKEKRAIEAAGRSRSAKRPRGEGVWGVQKKKIVETRDTLAAARRDTSIHCLPVTPPLPSHSFPTPFSLFRPFIAGGGVSELRALQQPGLGY